MTKWISITTLCHHGYNVNVCQVTVQRGMDTDVTYYTSLKQV